MNNLARKIHRDEVYEAVGVVARAEGKRFVVRTQVGEIDARRAVSCLVEPEVDDEVVVSVLGDGRAYVLAVLERDAGARARVVFDGDVDLEIKQGRFDVKAARGVSMTSGKDMDLTAGELNIRALASKIVLQKLSYVGTLLRAEVESVKTVAATLDSVLERFSQRAKRSYRHVEEIDQVRAKEMHYTAEDNLFMNGGNAVVTAEELVKVDGEQIHLG
jgi:hypothetical protein